MLQVNHENSTFQILDQNLFMNVVKECYIEYIYFTLLNCTVLYCTVLYCTLLCSTLLYSTLPSRARRAGAKMEPMLVGQRQYQPHSMDISLHFTPLFTTKRGEFGIKKQPLFFIKHGEHIKR